MKKNLFFYLFALVCAMPLFTSCSDDDKDIAIPTDELAGNYGGTLEISIDGVTVSGPNGIAQNINVTKAGDAAVSLSIVDFSFMGIEVGDINLTDCPLTVTGEDSYSFTAEPFDLSAADGKMTCTVKLNSGTIVDGLLTLNFDIDAQLGTVQQSVTVEFTGTHGTTVEIPSSGEQSQTNNIRYDFESWDKPTNATYDEVVNPVGWETCNNAVALIRRFGILGGITYTGENPVRPTEEAHSGNTAALLESVDTQGGVMLEQKVPKVTAGSMFLGTFDVMAAMTDPMATTRFGIEYDQKPVKVSGYFKYIPGTEFYNADGELQPEKKDACAINAVLYEVENEDETLDGSTIYTSDKIVAVALYGTDETVAEYTPFELNLEYAKEYDPAKKYKFAIIFSASADGANYNAAVGSRLYIDDVTVENEVVAE